MGGRLTLINRVLECIPTYSMSLHPITRKALKQLIKLEGTFLWEGNLSSHKFHLVKWDKVLLPKDLGGLDIKDLALHTQEDQWQWKEVIYYKTWSLESLVL